MNSCYRLVSISSPRASTNPLRPCRKYSMVVAGRKVCIEATCRCLPVALEVLEVVASVESGCQNSDHFSQGVACFPESMNCYAEHGLDRTPTVADL